LPILLEVVIRWIVCDIVHAIVVIAIELHNIGVGVDDHVTVTGYPRGPLVKLVLEIDLELFDLLLGNTIPAHDLANLAEGHEHNTEGHTIPSLVRPVAIIIETDGDAAVNVGRDNMIETILLGPLDVLGMAEEGLLEGALVVVRLITSTVASIAGDDGTEVVEVSGVDRIRIWLDG
jgi:hypothetical protein